MLAGVSLWPDSVTTVLAPALYGYPVAGFLIAYRRPGNRVAWVCLAVGFSYALEELLWGVAQYGLAHPGTVPRPELWAAFGHPLWLVWVPGAIIFLTLLFPNGRPPSPSWKWVPWAAGLLLGVGYVVSFFTLPPRWGRPLIDNPLAGTLPSAVGGLVYVGLALLAVACLGSLVVRYRRASGVERLQLKWLVTAGTAAVTIFIAIAIPMNTGVLDITVAAPMLALLLILFPASIGIAVLRYRLYDIDRILSRTVSYAVLVGLLAVVFATVAIGLPRLLGLPPTNQFLVAGATLAVAGLFNPLRRRVQARVDRHFNRARYDAQREVDRLAERLRAEVDVADLADEMLEVVTKTMQPSSVGVWVRREK